VEYAQVKRQHDKYKSIENYPEYDRCLHLSVFMLQTTSIMKMLSNVIKYSAAQALVSLLSDSSQAAEDEGTGR
jgi:hypothetical protein